MVVRIARVLLTALGLLLLRVPLHAQDLSRTANWSATPLRVDEIVTVGTEEAVAARRYDAGSLKEAVLGDAYRNVWDVPVDAPVLDLDRSGLSAVASDGDDSATLPLVASGGRRYVLKRLEKDAGDALPFGLRRTFIEDIAQDQVSSLNPFAPLVISSLAEAAGIRHIDPLLVFVPDSPRLGHARSNFAGKLALLEARPPELVGFTDMLSRIQDDVRFGVNEQAYARARLFDMWIGDRNRGADSWLWVAEGNRFEPVPIDREFAFARFDGLLNRIGRLIGKGRRQTYFGSDLENLSGLNHEAARLDYRLTSTLDRSDWIEAAEDLQAALTDPAIEESVARLPRPVFDEVGKETIEVLKNRRAGLTAAAEEYYRKMMQNIDVVGTNGSDRFNVSGLGDGNAEVVVSSSDRIILRREVLASETDELRLFGLAGDDEFVVSGDPGFAVFVVGGEGDETLHHEGKKRIRFFDTEHEPKSPGVKVKRLGKSSENRYRFHHFQFDRGAPAVAVDYDSDEGVYLGLGIRMKRYGFMREPYASRHILRANYAPSSNGYNISYDGRIDELVGNWDANFRANVLDEELYNDFYGLGNETSGSEANRRQYIAHFRWIKAYPAFYHSFGRYVQVGLGPYFEYANIEPPSGISEDAPVSGFTRHDFVDTYSVGVRSRFEADARDSELLTKSGFHIVAEAGVQTGIRRLDHRFVRLASDVSYFHTLPIPLRPTLALRAGGGRNFGDFRFFQANMLGGKENLRAYRKTRFAGRTSAYANSEIRFKLTDFNVYLTRGALGAFGFYDIGRVWMDGERSGQWHSGYGPGLWITPFYRFVITTSVGFSDEGRLFDVSFGMFF